MSSPTCLLSFSGGLDSVYCALELKRQGYELTLGHLAWYIGGTNFGEAQTVAAYNLAEALGLELEVLAYMGFPEQSFAKYSWVPVCISTIMHHAGDPCVYPAPNVRRYDSVAFGFEVSDIEQYVCGIKADWLASMRHTYDGEVHLPIDGMHRGEVVAKVPEHLRELVVSCYFGPSAEEPCGTCWKCLAA